MFERFYCWFYYSTHIEVSHRTVQYTLYSWIHKDIFHEVHLNSECKQKETHNLVGLLISSGRKVCLWTKWLMVLNLTGSIKSEKKSSEKWRPEWSGHFAPMPSTNIKIIVLGCIIYYKVGSWTFTYETTLRNIFKYLMTIFDRLFSNNLEIIHGTFIGPINLKIGNIIT